MLAKSEPINAGLCEHYIFRSLLRKSTLVMLDLRAKRIVLAPELVALNALCRGSFYQPEEIHVQFKRVC